MFPHHVIKHKNMKYKILLFLINLLFSTSFINAQKGIPNFTATDIYGNSHQLYSDYIDKGKYVFIDFFATSCAGCWDAATRIDTVYKNFGCNYGDLIFLGIDVADYGNYGTDSSIWNFTESYSMTFPAISGLDGGGSDIFDDFGYNYTPYHILISPEKQIIMDHWDFYSTSALQDTILKFPISLKECEGNNFIFYSLISAHDSIVGLINESEKTIYFEFPQNTDLSSLIANFRSAGRSSVYINVEEQISGINVNDFSSPVVYKISSETGNVENWTVNVNKNSDIEYLSSKYNIFPNPSSGVIVVENSYYLNTKLENIRVNILNISGKIIKSTVLDKKNMLIDLSNYSKGVYFITIQSKLGLITKKILLY